jgi:hypothetical protein
MFWDITPAHLGVCLHGFCLSQRNNLEENLGLEGEVHLQGQEENHD